MVVSETGALLEKPVDQNDARRMMVEHSGTKSIVHSAICLIEPSGKAHEALDSSILLFKKLSDDDIDWWIESNLWKDRSGAFQIEGKGQLIIEKLEGDWSGVVGLPLYLLGKLMEKAKCNLLRQGYGGQGVKSATSFAKATEVKE